MPSSVQSLSPNPVSFSFDGNIKPIIFKHVVLKKAYYKYSFPFSSSSSPLRRCRFVCSVEKESQQFEVDQDKAREALKQLDQQLQSISQKQVRSPKIKASDVNLMRDQTTEEAQEFSGSFLAYTAGALFLLTILYNVFFYSVIKPTIDGAYEAPTEVVERQIME